MFITVQDIDTESPIVVHLTNLQGLRVHPGAAEHELYIEGDAIRITTDDAVRVLAVLSSANELATISEDALFTPTIRAWFIKHVEIFEPEFKEPDHVE